VAKAFKKPFYRATINVSFWTHLKPISVRGSRFWSAEQAGQSPKGYLRGAPKTDIVKKHLKSF